MSKSKAQDLEQRCASLEKENTKLSNRLKSLESKVGSLTAKELEKIDLEIDLLNQQKDRAIAESGRAQRFSWRWHGFAKFLSTCLVLLAALGVAWTFIQWKTDYRRERFQTALSLLKDNQVGGVILLGKVSREDSWGNPKRKGQAVLAIAATLASTKDPILRELCIQQLEEFPSLTLADSEKVRLSAIDLLNASPNQADWGKTPEQILPPAKNN